MNKSELLNVLKGIRQTSSPIRAIDLNQRDTGKNTLLHVAVKEEDAVSVKKLLEMGIDVNARNDHQISSLDYAFYKGNTVIIQCLLEYGARLNVLAHGGATVWHITARYGLQEIAVYLLSQKEFDLLAEDNNGRTPLEYAAEHNQQSMGEWLLDQTFSSLLIKNEVSDILASAVAYGWLSTVERLLTRVESANHCDKDGDTLLTTAAKEGHTAIVSFLLKKGAKPDGNDVLVAAAQNDTEMVKCLIEHDIDLDITDEYGQRAFSYAMRHGNIHMAQSLLQHPNKKNDPADLLDVVSKPEDYDEIMRLLLDRVDITDNFFVNLLGNAILKGNQKIVRLLLNREVISEHCSAALQCAIGGA